MTFLGWTRLHATWIKPEVVAAKKIYGILTLPVHHDWIQVFMEFVLFIYVIFGVLVCPCQLFVRLCYRVSNVLDLSLVTKRFGFWPHITHVIVLTFKEIKHLSDYRTVGLYRSLQVYQRSNTLVGHRVFSDFTLKIVRPNCPTNVRPNPPRSEWESPLSDS